MFDRDFSAVFVGGVVSALVLALAGCAQPAQVVEVPAVEVPIEVTREVPSPTRFQKGESFNIGLGEYPPIMLAAARNASLTSTRAIGKAGIHG